MAVLQVNDAEIYYEEHGNGPETIVFAHGLVRNSREFDKQVAALKKRYRCIVFDFRGHGKSMVTKTGYDIDTLTGDTAMLIEKLQAAPCHFMGTSIGGMVGMRLALRHPGLLKTLTLANTTADPEPKKSFIRYRVLRFIAYWFGLTVVADRVMNIIFGEKFLNDPSRAQEKENWRAHMVAQNRIGLVRAVKGSIPRPGIYEQLGNLSISTLILAGEQDKATVPAKAERMHTQIPDSKLVKIPDAGHALCIEEPEAANAALQGFLAESKDKSLHKNL